MNFLEDKKEEVILFEWKNIGEVIRNTLLSQVRMCSPDIGVVGSAGANNNMWDIGKTFASLSRSSS